MCKNSQNFHEEIQAYFYILICLVKKIGFLRSLDNGQQCILCSIRFSVPLLWFPESPSFDFLFVTSTRSQGRSQGHNQEQEVEGKLFNLFFYNILTSQKSHIPTNNHFAIKKSLNKTIDYPLKKKLLGFWSLSSLIKSFFYFFFLMYIFLKTSEYKQ